PSFLGEVEQRLRIGKRQPDQSAKCAETRSNHIQSRKDGGDAGIRTHRAPFRARWFNKPLVSATRSRLRPARIFCNILNTLYIFDYTGCPFPLQEKQFPGLRGAIDRIAASEICLIARACVVSRR